MLVLLTACSQQKASQAPSKTPTPSIIAEFGADNPADLTIGPDGTIWFTEHEPNYVGRITSKGSISLFTTPVVGDKRGGITAGPDGDIWFVSLGPTTKIGRLTPVGGFTMFALPHGGDIYNLTTGPDGNLWFCEYANNQIGRITPTGAVTEFALPTPGSHPQSITTGSDGNL